MHTIMALGGSTRRTAACGGVVLLQSSCAKTLNIDRELLSLSTDSLLEHRRLPGLSSGLSYYHYYYYYSSASSSYSPGDLVTANCSSLRSLPETHLVWYINGSPVRPGPGQSKHFRPEEYAPSSLGVLRRVS